MSDTKNIKFGPIKNRNERLNYCRVCNRYCILSAEHVIPEGSGGGRSANIYTAEEVIDSLSTHKKPKYDPSQKGYIKYALCERCNNLSGSRYDDSFNYFYKSINGLVYNQLIEDPDKYTINEIKKKMADTVVVFKMKKIKPFNIAKRLLVMFCAVESYGLAKSNTEIKDAILERDYKPNTDNFSLYLGLNYGTESLYGTVTLLDPSDGEEIRSFSGIETMFTSFYMSLNGSKGPKDRLDITNWLTDYNYDQEVDMEFTLAFMDNAALKLTIPGID